MFVGVSFRPSSSVRTNCRKKRRRRKRRRKKRRRKKRRGLKESERDNILSKEIGECGGGGGGGGAFTRKEKNMPPADRKCHRS